MFEEQQGNQPIQNPAQMANELNDDEEMKLWPPLIEKLFIELMVDEQGKGNMQNGVFYKRTWTKIHSELNVRAKRNFRFKQVKAKFNRLRQRHRIFSQLLQHSGLSWDAETNTVTASNEVWGNVLAEFPKAKEFRRKGCDNYIQLGLLFNKTTVNSVLASASTQDLTNTDEDRELDEERELDEQFRTAGTDVDVDVDVDSDSTDDIEHTKRDVDATHPGKRLMHGGHPQPKKSVKKGDKISEMTEAINNFTALSKARFEARQARTSGNSSRHVGELAKVDEDFSLRKAIQLLNQYKDLPHGKWLKVMRELYNSDNRVAFLTMEDDRRMAWMELIGYGF